MTRPTLSAVMANFNHARYLAEAIEGIAGQSRQPDEFLVLDDASTDHSLAVIEPYLERFPFMRLIRHDRNRGVVAAYRRLFAEAACDYVYAAAADDVRLPGFFAQAMGLAEQYPEAGLIFGAIGMIDDQGRRLGTIDARCWVAPTFAPPDRFLQEYLLVERPSHSACSGTIYRRDALMEVGAYRLELGSWADTFAFRAIGLKYGACYAPQEFVVFRRLAGSFSMESGAEPRKILDVIARAEHLMRTPDFRDRFSAEYVRHWRRAYRWQVIRDDFLGDQPPGTPRASFLIRNLRRLPRVFRALALFCYRGDLSCYDR